MHKPEYKTQFIDRGKEWSVVQSDGKNKPKTICIIPNYYQQDEALANSIASLLNNNDKIIINLDI